MKQGITLIETVIAIGLAFLIFAVVFALGRDIFFNNRFYSGLLANEFEVKSALRRFSAELRSAEMSAAGAYPIESANSGQIVFFSDSDKDGIAEKIGYELVGGKFIRSVIVAAGSPPVYSTSSVSETVVANNLSASSSLSYFGADYDGALETPLSFPIDVTEARMVKLFLVWDGINPFNLETSVTIRNLRN